MEGEGTEIRRPFVKATAVVEQRVTHFLMGLALIGTMTGPLLAVLHTIPSAVFAGVFFVVGVSTCLAVTPEKTPSADHLPVLVGLYRIERYPREAHRPPIREAIYSKNRSHAHGAPPQSLPLRWASDGRGPRLRGYLSHLGRYRLSHSDHPAHPAEGSPHAKVVHPQRATGA